MILDIPRSQSHELVPSISVSWESTPQASMLLTIVPNVTKPTKAFSGRRLKLMTRDSLSEFRLSSSWHVSTTYRKIGGLGAGRESLYSIVVFDGCNSGGMAFAVISL